MTYSVSEKIKYFAMLFLEMISSVKSIANSFALKIVFSFGSCFYFNVLTMYDCSAYCICLLWPVSEAACDFWKIFPDFFNFSRDMTGISLSFLQRVKSVLGTLMF